MKEPGLTRAQVGNGYGSLTFMFAVTAPLAGRAIARWGARLVLVTGNLIMAAGFWG